MVFLRPIGGDTSPLYVSANVDQFGYSAEQVVSGEVSWWGIVHSSDAERIEREEQGYLKQGQKTYQQRYRIVTAAGEVRWIEDWNTVIRDERGETTHVQGLMLDVTGRQRVEDSLLHTYTELQEKTLQIDEANAALQDALRLVEVQRERVTAELLANLHGLLLPMLDHLKANTSGVNRRYVELVEESLRTLTDPFVGRLEGRRYGLTPAELQICYLIRGGLATKQIARSQSVSVETVRTHRRNIRRKLGLARSGRNLAVFLKNLGVSGQPRPDPGLHGDD